MKRDDIIRMALEVGLLDRRDDTNDGAIAGFVGTLMDFANMVAAAEREACAKICGRLADNPENSEQYRMGANWAREMIRARGNADA